MLTVNTSSSAFESGGREISCDTFIPSSQNGERFPAVIGLHGSAGGHATMAEPAALLAAQGFAVYVVHYFDRTGTTGVADKQTAVRNFPVWGKTVWDSVSHIASRPEVDAQRIGLLGFSLGAYLSLASASIDPRIKAVVDFFGGFPKEMKLFMRRFCPVLILHGEADDTVPVSEAHYIALLAEKKNVPYELQIYPGAGHGFTPEIMADASQRTLNFLRKYLKQAAI